jgi:hypothetical protein
MPKNDPKGYGRDTSWDQLGYWDLDDGAKVSSFVLGDPEDPTSPVIFTGSYPPGARTEPHHHVIDYAEIILEGSQQVTRKWYYPGDVRIVEAGTAYGPLIAGPDGVKTIVIFRNQNWQSVGIKPANFVGGPTPRAI